MSSASTTGATSAPPKTPSTPPAQRAKKSKIPSVLTWSDPIRSGTILGEILATLFVIRYGNLLRLALKLTYYAIGATGLVELATRYFNGGKQGVVSSYKPSRFISINQYSLEKYTNRTISWLSDGVAELKKLFDAEDLGLSFVAFIAVFAMYVLTGFVSVSTLTFIATIVAFTLPRLYLQFQPEIDEAVGVVHKQAVEQYNVVSGKVHEAAGPHLEKARTQIEGVASKVGINMVLNRGGFPQTPADKKSAPIANPADIPGSTAKINVDQVSEKTPKLSTEARTVDGVTYDSVPTLAGNVNLKSGEGESSKAEYPVVNATAISEEIKNKVNDESESVEDLASDLKSSINNDKQQSSASVAE